jgi:hypothetical protein
MDGECLSGIITSEVAITEPMPLAVEPVYCRDALNARHVALKSPSTRGRNILTASLGILMETGGKAVEAKIRWTVSIVKLL